MKNAMEPKRQSRISTKWRLSSADKAKLEQALCDGSIKSDLITVSRRYGKEIDINVDLDFPTILNGLYTRFQLDELEYRAVLSKVKNTTDLIGTLNKLSPPSERHQKLKAHMDAQGSASAQVGKVVQAMLPKFMYFSSYDRMAGAIQLEQTRELTANQQINADTYRGIRLFAEFLDYAGVSINAITQATTYETFNARLQAASNNITDQVLEYWTQIIPT